jgi:hypothetical protein
MTTTLKGGKGGRWSSDLVLDLYSNLLKEMWELVSALIGEAILAYLFTLAIRKIGEKYPFLNSIRVSEEGVSIEEVRRDYQTLAAVEIHRGFQGLVNHLSQLFSALAEGVINKELFPKVFPKFKEADRIISQK